MKINHLIQFVKGPLDTDSDYDPDHLAAVEYLEVKS